MKKTTAVCAIAMTIVLTTGCINTVREAPPELMPSPSVATPAPEATLEPAEDIYDYSKAPESEFVGYAKTNVCLNEACPDSYDLLVESSYDEIEITSDHSALAQAVSEWNEENAASVKETTANLYDMALEDYDYMHGIVYANEEKMYIRRADNKVFSVELDDYMYMGGAHPSSGIYGANFDTQTGKMLSIGDIFPNDEVLVDSLVKELEAKYATEYFFYKDSSETPTLKSYIMQYYMDPDGRISIPFYMTYGGVVFYFGEYGLAPYVAGNLSVVLSYDKYWQIMNEYYAKDVSKDYLMAIKTYDEYDVAPDFGLGLGYGESTEYPTSIDVMLGDQSAQITDLDIGDVFPYLLCKDGKKFLLVDVYSYYEYYSKVYVFDVSDKSPAFIGEYDGWVENPTDPDFIKIVNQCDVLGTYPLYAYYNINSEGQLEKMSDYYITMPYESLVSTVELTGDVVDLGTYVKTGEEKTFPAGTSFDAVATDNESIVILKSSDGDYALFDISLEWPQTIEGKAAEECFESLFYAS